MQRRMPPQAGGRGAALARRVAPLWARGCGHHGGMFMHGKIRGIGTDMAQYRQSIVDIAAKKEGASWRAGRLAHRINWKNLPDF